VTLVEDMCLLLVPVRYVKSHRDPTLVEIDCGPAKQILSRLRLHLRSHLFLHPHLGQNRQYFL